MIPFQALIFDLDGTLVNSVPDVRASINYGLNSMGLGSITNQNTHDLVGGGAIPLVKGALKLTGGRVTPDHIDQLLTLFLGYYKTNPAVHSHLYDGVLNVLDDCLSAGIKMAVCTNKPEATTHPVLQAFDLTKYFTSIRTGDTVPYKKPDARHIQLCLDDLGADIHNTVFIGDSETDINTANNAKMLSVCVTYGYCHQPYESLDASILIDDFGVLIPALNTIHMQSNSS